MRKFINWLMEQIMPKKQNDIPVVDLEKLRRSHELEMEFAKTIRKRMQILELRTEELLAESREKNRNNTWNN